MKLEFAEIRSFRPSNVDTFQGFLYWGVRGGGGVIGLRPPTNQKFVHPHHLAKSPHQIFISSPPKVNSHH